MVSLFLSWITACLLLLIVLVDETNGFQPASAFRNTQKSSTTLLATTKGYEPKWKKKATLAEEEGGGKTMNFQEKGLTGSVPVVFTQGNVTRTTLALRGQPLSDVASQAGQFIKYGCGKGECGTCECLCNGQWIRPCTSNVPMDMEYGQQLVIQVKEVQNKAKSSGKFYSLRSFLWGFYNNVLGMVGFVKTRKQAKANWQERQDYETLIAQLTLEKRAQRLAKEQANSNKLKP